MIVLKFVDYKTDSTLDVNNDRTNVVVKQASTHSNTRFFTGKPFKDKNPEALIIHPLNEMIEFVHEHNFEMNVDTKFPTKILQPVFFQSEKALIHYFY